MNICTICGRVYEWNSTAGHSKAKCNSCIVNIRRFSLKDRCIEYLGGHCASCGYKKCKAALVFHHKNPKTKSFNISGSHARSWKVIEQELNKCILLCANCHSEIHS